MKWRRVSWIAAIFAAQLACLVVAAQRNRHMLNPDAVAYLQVARHLLRGEIALAINGYWGPLLSWIALPFLAATADLFLAARCAMLVSALAFSGGALVLFARSRLPFAAIVVATAACAFVSVHWSVAEITPDLLSDGLLLAGFGVLQSREWPQDRSVQARSGVLLGIAYLAKAVMLPVAIVTLGAIAAHHLLRRHEPPAVLRAAGRTLLFLLIVALPWIAVLSVHYGRPLFSTAGPIAHALVGPRDVDRRNPIILEFRHPKPGRVVDSEDPDPRRFRNWSPFANREYLRWQLRTIRENLASIHDYLNSFASAHLCAILLMIAFAIALVSPRRTDDAPSLLAAIPILVAACVYATVFAASPRYYVFAIPLMLAAAGGIGCAMARRSGAVAIGLTAIAALAVVWSARTQFRSAFTALPNPSSRAAIDLAMKMRTHGMIGPVAGTAPVDGGMAGLYTAFLLDVPWCGDEPQPRIATLRASDTRFWIVGTDDREKLNSIPSTDARDVTPVLYGNAPAPVVVREVIR